jgi:hypothetical protein
LNDQVKEDEMGRACSTNGAGGMHVEGKPEGRRPLGRPRCKWVDNIQMEIGWGCMDWIDLAEDGNQWEGCCEHGNEHSGSIKCWEIRE